MNIIYHANCADGFTAAWLLARIYGENNKFFPMQYGDPFPEVDSSPIIMADFCCEIPEHLSNEVTIYDHHIGAKDLYDKLHSRIMSKSKFDITECGASLVFKNEFTHGEDLERVVRYVRDRDLWIWARPYSREINAYIQNLPFEFKAWDNLCSYLKTNFETIIRLGEAIIDTNDKIIKQVKPETLNGVTYVNAHCMKSEIGNHFGPGPVIVWNMARDDVYGSVRGKDALRIAKVFGGGGHELAAGFKCSFADFLSLRMGVHASEKPT